MFPRNATSLSQWDEATSWLAMEFVWDWYFCYFHHLLTNTRVNVCALRWCSWIYGAWLAEHDRLPLLGAVFAFPSPLPFFPCRSVGFFILAVGSQPSGLVAAFMFFFPNVISSAVKKKGIQHLNISSWDVWWLGNFGAPLFFALDRIHYLWWCLGISRRENDMRSDSSAVIWRDRTMHST